MKKQAAPTFTRSYAAIIDYLLQFGMSRIYENAEGEYPRTSGAFIGFVSCRISGGEGAKPDDLIRLESARAGKWRLSWLKEVRPMGGGDCSYLCESIVDGELCWWSNVGISYLHRPTLAGHPTWRWSDEQYAFDDKWEKACRRHDAYIYLPMLTVFNEDGTATIGTRARHQFADCRPTRIIQNWKKATIKALAQHYLDMVAEHSAQKKVAQ